MKINKLLFAMAAGTAAFVFSGCAGNISFKAQEAVVVPGTRYLLTVETLDSTRTETVTPDCSTIPGISVELRWEKDGDDLVARATVRNDNPDYVVKSLEGPIVDGLDFRLEDFHLMMPFGMGELYRKCPAEADDKAPMLRDVLWKKKDGKYVLSAGYPSRNMSMQWCAFASEERGLYFASHDPARKGKEFNVVYDPSDSTFSVSLRHLFTCFAGQEYEVPETRIHSYSGTWHKAADYYKTWFDGCFDYVHEPEWLKECSGWLLAITKQQNEEVMWNYDEYAGGLSDAAIDRGLDIIGLFAWAHGGHDRFYPDYYPDPERGGEEGLRKAVKGIKDHGLRTIMYVNGQLIDQDGTQFWPDTGRFITMMNKDGSLISETWHKYYDAPARTHGRACFSCDVWHRRMLSLAKMAQEYGADGIIYDQLATRAPLFCYGENHGHTVPAVVVEQDRLDFITEIREEMSRIDPEFVVMTEGVADYEMSCINIFHGCSFDVYPPDQAAMEDRMTGRAGATWFPEMTEYTFPEMLMTVRNPAPVTSRNMSNFTLVSHLKNEIECRYRADVRYLKENRIPEIEDYANVTTKPDLSLVRSQDPVAMRIYQKCLADFQGRHKDLLRLGRFMDTQGFTFNGSHELCMAKAFVSGDRTGVVVWNISSDKPLEYEVSVPGKTLVAAESPEGLETSSVSPESIVLLIYE
ncbi:MAG: DUF6259 domain-containing protein [Candidatus Cryptobacteroides sp.]